MSEFIRAAGKGVNTRHIVWADFREIEDLKVRIYTTEGGLHVAEGPDAIEAAMVLKPSILEGRRLRWLRHQWAAHNLVGHPLMQLLALGGFHRQAMKVHERTVPRPRG